MRGLRRFNRCVFPHTTACYLTVLSIIFLSGCAAMLVPYTSDPKQKLADAYLMCDTGRFLPAERFANEALQEFKAGGNATWQAEAYFFLGGLYRGSAYRKHEKFLTKSNLPYDPTSGTSIKNYRQAIDIWSQLGDLTGVAKAKFELGNTYGLDKDIAGQCLMFRESLADYQAGKALPTSQQFTIRNPHFKDFEDMVRTFMRDHGCDAK